MHTPEQLTRKDEKTPVYKLFGGLAIFTHAEQAMWLSGSTPQYIH